MYLEPVRRDGPGRFADRGVEGINLGLAIDQNISAYKIFLIKERVIKVTNQVTFDEDYFPMKAAARSKSSQVAEEPSPLRTHSHLRMEDAWLVSTYTCCNLGSSL